MLRTFPPLVLPENVLYFEGEQFFDVGNKTCGNIFKELMEVLSINTVYKLLLVENDILPVFQKRYRELENISQRACLHLDDGTIMLKLGLRLDFDRFITALHVVKDHKQQREETASSNEDFISLFQKLMKSNQLNKTNDKDYNYSFLIEFIENIFDNLKRNKNNYRYSEAVQNFAQALYILGGRNVYEYIRLNLPGSLPGLSTINEILGKDVGNIEDGIFRYDVLHSNQKSSGYQFTVFFEDSTAVIKKITYNAATNTFTGFLLPLKHGIPKSHYFQTNSSDQLQEWFNNMEKTRQLNIHMVQPLIKSNPYAAPFLLAAYGISNSFKSVDVLNRWLWMFDKSQQSNVRILSFSTDCDPRYLLSMRLATGFFARYTNTSISDRNDALEINIPKNWSSWFYMRSRQAFFCFQDGVHLCTKLRNRMLSETASMLIGNEEVSINILINLIESKSKLIHGLVKTDIEPKDKQNFSSCLKIVSDDVLVALEDIDYSQATLVYLRLLRSVMLAYVEHNTSVLDRTYHAWLAVFLCRIWQTWLHIADQKNFSGYYSQKTKNSLFITSPAHFSIELNAHCLVSICLLVCQHDLPNSVLSISNYNSQSCENTFRLARSLSGTFSSIVNFTIEKFLKRAGKLSVLTKLESQIQSGLLKCPLQFSRHHKQRRKNAAAKTSLSNSSSSGILTYENIENTVWRAYDDAYALLSGLGVDKALEKRKTTNIHQVSSFVRTQFEKKFKKVSYDDDDNLSSDDENDELNYNVSSDANSLSTSDEESSEDENDVSSISASSKSHFNGMRVFDTISPSVSDSYFCVEIDGKKKYIHKQTTCWLLTDSNAHLSSDRLKRVQQASY